MASLSDDKAGLEITCLYQAAAIAQTIDPIVLAAESPAKASAPPQLAEAELDQSILNQALLNGALELLATSALLVTP